MFKSLTKLLGGDPVQRQLDAYAEQVQLINALEPQMKALSDDELKAKTQEFRDRLAQGETLDDLLFEAFAVVREVSVRTIGLRHFDVQMIGGIVLHKGIIAEMKTGEGKTLVATLPIYLNALDGRGVHLITVNDYLARRDARWMGPIFHFLGLSVGVLQEAARTESGRKAFLYDPQKESTQEDVNQLQMVDRKLAYLADITYGTNNEFGFDYLRDNMARRLDARSQRGHHYAILDEVDNILIDEARTPLIISGPSHEDPEQYLRMAQVVKQLRPEDLEVSEKDRTVVLTEIGENHVEELLGQALRDPDRPEDITPEQAQLLGYLEQAMRAEYLFKRNKDYVVQGGRVIIVDEFTGRLMSGRRWSDGLHQAVEAKENVRVRQENVTYATITLQNYFRMYDKLAGMTGTALTEAEEFNDIYNVDVLPLPTNLEYIAMQPDTDLVDVEFRENGNRFTMYVRKDDEEQAPIFWKRKDYPDVVYRTEEAKLRAIVTEILQRHVIGQPLLVGTTSVELSERLSSRLRAGSLRMLANVLILRDAYMEAHDIPDDGRRIKALEALNAPLDSLNSSVMRPFAKELNLSLNPTKDANLTRFAAVLGLEEEYIETLGKVIDSGIRHNVLNAKKHDEESRIIADAGAVGAVTIATNMAGRGVDIKLGGEIAEEVLAAINRVLRRSGVDDPETLNLEERLEILQNADEDAIGIYGAEVDLFQEFMLGEKQVKAVGGLHVIGSERHESRRIDNQLRGRAARQGDPGSSQFFLSLEDELMRLFGGTQVSGLMARLNIDDMMPIAHNMVNRTIEQAQTRVEGAHFDTRKHLLEYDDVLNQQREVFYGMRNRVFAKDDLLEDVDVMLVQEVADHVSVAMADPDGLWKLLAWLEEIQPTINLETEHPYPSYMLRLLLDELKDVETAEALSAALLELGRKALNTQYAFLARAVEEQLERSLERMDDQVRQRVEMAELAIEGAQIEAEEQGRDVRPRDLLNVIEANAGMRIRLDDDTRMALGDNIDTLRRRVPELIEASLGLRVWAGMVHAVERRLGEELSLEKSLPVPIDWDQAADALLMATEKAWKQRSERLEKEPVVNDALKLQLLVRMSYGQQTYFDRKTHQKRAMRVARLSYAYSAAELIPSHEEEQALVDKIIAHLRNARSALAESFGYAELSRIGGGRDALQNGLEPSTLTRLQEVEILSAIDDQDRAEVVQVLGERLMTEGYRSIILSVGDRLWVDYLTEIEALRTSIGLEAYGQRDPLVQYKSRAFDMFQHLLGSIRTGVVSHLFRGRVSKASVTPAGVAPASSSPSTPKPAKSGKRRRRRR